MGLMNYDPNMVNSGRMAKQSVKLTFGMWEYRKTIEVVVGGNCTGLTAIESAVDMALETLYDENDCATIVLENPAKDTLECVDDEGQHDEWLKGMLVSAEIVSIVADGDFHTKVELANDSLATD